MTNLDLFDAAAEAPQPADAPIERAPGHWFNIPAHRPFLADVAAGLHRTLARLGPEALAEAVVLTPTRRTARALAEAFVEVGGGKATLLPQIRTLGDVDADEPPFEPETSPPACRPPSPRNDACSNWRASWRRTPTPWAAASTPSRRCAWPRPWRVPGRGADRGGARYAGADRGPGAARTGSALGNLHPLPATGPGGLAGAAQRPGPDRREAASGRLLRALATKWTHEPPPGVLIAAGVHDDSKATAAVLCAVAGAPRGR